jgi:cytidyltransferase-like protein
MKNKKKVVYCYLCADILHIGHLRHLERARANGDFVIAGILTDKAVMEKKIKPIIPFEERLETIEAIKYVDLVVPQYTYSPLNNVKKFRPDVLMESESHPEQPANDFVKSYGGKVVISPYYDLQSSSNIKKLIKKSWKQSKK